MTILANSRAWWQKAAQCSKHSVRQLSVHAVPDSRSEALVQLAGWPFALFILCHCSLALGWPRTSCCLLSSDLCLKLLVR